MGAILCVLRVEWRCGLALTTAVMIYLHSRWFPRQHRTMIRYLLAFRYINLTIYMYVEGRVLAVTRALYRTAILCGQRWTIHLR